MGRTYRPTLTVRSWSPKGSNWMGMLRRHMKNGAVFADSLSSLRDLEKIWDAVIVGNPLIAKSPRGNVLDLDGVSDYIDLGAFDQNDLAVASTWSLEVWFKADVTDSQDVIFASSVGTNDRIAIYITADIIRASIYDGSFTSKSSAFVDTDSWHHIVMVNAAGTLTVYLDGAAITGTDDASTSATVATFIGARTSGTFLFNGKVGELTIFPHAFSAAEAAQLYKGTTNDYMLDLHASWELDTTSTAADAIQDLGWKAGGYHLTGASIATIVDGPAPGSRGVTLDGSADYADIADLEITAYPFTLAAWFRGTGTGPHEVIIDLADSALNTTNFSIKMKSGSIVSSARSEDAFEESTGVSANDGAWHHGVCVFASATSRKLYLDGVFVDEATGSKPLSSGMNRFSIGRFGDTTPSSNFPGDAALPRFFAAALSGLQVMDLYERERRGAA